METKTLGFVLQQKLVSIIEQNSFGRLLTFIGLAFAAGLASAAVINFDGTIQFLGTIVRWNDYAPAKIGTVFFFVFNAKRIGLFIWKNILELIEFMADTPEPETIDGIPIPELLDHLFTQKTFKQDEIESKFGVPRYKHTLLSKKLKELGVLVRGENNAGILNEEFSRQDLALILRGKLTATDLRPLFRRRGDSLTSDPSALEIETRVEALLSSGFNRREIREPLLRAV